MSRTEELFTMIEALVASRPFTPEQVSKITGFRFDTTPGRSTGAFSIFEAQDGAHSLVQAVELRAPNPGTKARDGMVILTLQPTLCVEVKAVTARFGEHASRELSRSHSNEYMHLLYRVPWGQMRFGRL